ncbi:alpha/beta hydrolase [Corynebacterium sp. HMSC063A05]|nr:alpha/beta hydrolase [Corynebacterium amycolatum]MBC6758715.1 alpha/beta hydrolase [Corynebacterium sp. LK24]OFM85870.1 alpha/beta hydrolase [Corynebacterium sp. HMSC063A05]OFN06784.1 alpha/beta hydrolase [Corynebacterium sp. HMSC074C11]OFR91883.1 alpha/beta hydrolase [Corynebacterium sp. HMSC064E10]OFU56152.1 alpha/beta hydrolase [Corynebacterium sp. HMSC11H10]
MPLIVKLFTVADNLKTLTSNLSKRGPHRVMVGDLAFTGLPGKVYTPAEGNGIPGIAFAHDWRTPIEEYHATLRHLASWGIAVAAPDTENGIVADHRGLANDLETALQILAGVRLGEGKVVVHPKKLGVAGHGMGAGVAVLAAAGHDIISGVGCVYPATTAPSSSAAATNVSAPGLVLAPGEDKWLDRGNPARLAVQWKGDVVYREVDNADQSSFSETTLLRRLAGFSSSKVKYQEVARAALTGFLLATVGDDKKYSDFADPTATIKGTTNRDMEWLIKELPENPEHSLVPGK